VLFGVGYLDLGRLETGEFLAMTVAADQAREQAQEA
jgi:hypothetical protein